MTAGVHERSRGSATVLATTVIALVAMATGIAIAVGLATETRHRAVAAADAAALAAAADAIDGAASACARGSDLAAANGARQISCTVVDAIADVRVEVRPPGVLAVFGPVVARARAGPAGGEPIAWFRRLNTEEMPDIDRNWIGTGSAAPT